MNILGLKRWRSIQPTLRMRLTLVYGGAFLVAGCVLVAVMYLLVRNRLGPTGQTVIRASAPSTPPRPRPMSCSSMAFPMAR